MLIAILMSLNIVSVGYATWAITGSSTAEAGGSFGSYPVIKSEEYVNLTAITPMFVHFYNAPIGQTQKTQGAFLKLDENGFIDDKFALSQSAELIFTYTIKERLDNMTIQTEFCFGENADFSESFFAIAVPSSKVDVTGAKATSVTKTGKGTYSFTLSEVEGNTVTVKIILTIGEGQIFEGDYLGSEATPGSHSFYADTVVKGTLQ